MCGPSVYYGFAVRASTAWFLLPAHSQDRDVISQSDLWLAGEFLITIFCSLAILNFFEAPVVFFWLDVFAAVSFEC